MSDPEALIAQLESTGDYRVLRRLKSVPLSTSESEHLYTGFFVDIESTGLDVTKDEIIEFGGIPFSFTSDGAITALGNPIHSYNEPSCPISEESTHITGINANTVKGHKLAVVDIEAQALASDLIIAHNAAFDRPILERHIPAFASKHWGCSMSQVDWPGGKRLEYILASLGYFYDAHGAIEDCMAGLTALSGGRLASVLEAARQSTWHVWAIDAAYAAKDKLKERGYYWDGEKKNWHKEVGDADAERLWLRDNVYGPSLIERAKFVKVTAFDRFSVRG